MDFRALLKLTSSVDPKPVTFLASKKLNEEVDESKKRELEKQLGAQKKALANASFHDKDTRKDIEDAIKDTEKELKDKSLTESHSHEKCMECDAKPTKECKWAEGMGHAWFCDKCYEKWSTTGDGKGDVVALKAITDGKAAKKFADNKNPNLLKEAKIEERQGSVIKHLEFEVEEADSTVEGDKSFFPYTAEVEIIYDVDSSYGEDADGNRGTTMTFIDDVKILSVEKEGVAMDITKLPDAVVSAINNAAENADLNERLLEKFGLNEARKITPQNIQKALQVLNRPELKNIQVPLTTAVQQLVSMMDEMHVEDAHDFLKDYEVAEELAGRLPKIAPELLQRVAYVVSQLLLSSLPPRDLNGHIDISWEGFDTHDADESKVNEGVKQRYDDYVSNYKQRKTLHKSAGAQPKEDMLTFDAFKEKEWASGRKGNESKVNEDDMMQGGATQASGGAELAAGGQATTPKKEDAQQPETQKEETAKDADKEKEKDKNEAEGEAEKEALGNNGSDKYFYLVRKMTKDNSVEELQVLDAEDEVVFTSKDDGSLDLEDIVKFLQEAFKKLEIANINYEIVEKYFFPDKEETSQVHEPAPEEVKEPTPLEKSTPNESKLVEDVVDVEPHGPNDKVTKFKVNYLNPAGHEGISFCETLPEAEKRSAELQAAGCKHVEIVSHGAEKFADELEPALVESKINESTHARIGVELPNGQIKSIYVQMDGYPSHTLKTLQKYYKDAAKVEALMNVGDIRFLDRSPELSAKGSYQEAAKVSKDYEQFDEIAGDNGVEYSYIFKGGKWVKTFDSCEEFNGGDSGLIVARKDESKVNEVYDSHKCALAGATLAGEIQGIVNTFDAEYKFYSATEFVTRIKKQLSDAVAKYNTSKTGEEQMDEPVGESLLMKYGFASEETSKLLEKFGLLIEEANKVNEVELSPEDIARIKKEVDQDFKKEFRKEKGIAEKDKSSPCGAFHKCNNAEGCDDCEHDVEESKVDEAKKCQFCGIANTKAIETWKNGACPDCQKGDQYKRTIAAEKAKGAKVEEAKVNEADLMPQQAVGEIPTKEMPTTQEGDIVADKAPAALVADYSTPEAAKSQIQMDYPEEPLTTTAMVFADSFVNDPKVYRNLRKLQWDGVYNDSKGFLAQSKIVGDYRDFTTDVAKLLVDRLGNGAKYKLGRNNGPTVSIVIRDPQYSISLSGLKELVQAQEIKKTNEPGEVVLSW